MRERIRAVAAHILILAAAVILLHRHAGAVVVHRHVGHTSVAEAVENIGRHSVVVDSLNWCVEQLRVNDAREDFLNLAQQQRHELEVVIVDGHANTPEYLKVLLGTRSCRAARRRRIGQVGDQVRGYLEQLGNLCVCVLEGKIRDERA